MKIKRQLSTIMIYYYISGFNSRRKKEKEKEKEKKTPEFKAKVACPRLHIKVFFKN